MTSDSTHLRTDETVQVKTSKGTSRHTEIKFWKSPIESWTVEDISLSTRGVCLDHIIWKHWYVNNNMFLSFKGVCFSKH